MYVSNVDICNCNFSQPHCIHQGNKSLGDFPWVAVCIQRQLLGVKKTKIRGTFQVWRPTRLSSCGRANCFCTLVCTCEKSTLRINTGVFTLAILVTVNTK